MIERNHEINMIVKLLSNQPIKKSLTPENHFLSLQEFSSDEKKYIEEQDYFRKKQYQDKLKQIAKKVSEKPNEMISSLNALKQQQKVSRDETSEYIVKSIQNRP